MNSALRRVLRDGLLHGVRQRDGHSRSRGARGGGLRHRGWIGVLLCSACGLQLENAAADGTGDGTEQDSEQNRPATGNIIPGGRVSGGSGGAPSRPPPTFAEGVQRGVELQGSVQYSFEDASFLHCGLQELWAVRFEGLAFERFQDLALGEECDIANCLFLLAGSGDLSARGRFGNVREYPRELTVTRVTTLERVTRVADLASLNGISCPR